MAELRPLQFSTEAISHNTAADRPDRVYDHFPMQYFIGSLA